MTDFIKWHGSIPHNTEFNDSYYSHDGGYAESQHVYVSGVNLPDLALSGRHVRLAELGFGTGLNFLATALCWQQYGSGKLHYCAIEKFPLPLAVMERAWNAFPELWPLISQAKICFGPWVKGFQRLWFSKNIVLDVYVGDVTEQLPNWKKPFDGWYLDGFAPSRNPEMFSEDVLEHVARLSKSGTRLASFTVAGVVRRGLEARGFVVHKAVGFGKKSQCLRAIKQKNNLNNVKNIKNSKYIAIIGSGVSGSSLAQQIHWFADFEDSEVKITLVSPKNQQYAASSVPVAAISPRFSANQSDRGLMVAQAFRYACRYYDTFAPEAWRYSRGAIKVPSPALDESRLNKAAESWSDWGVAMLNAEAVQERFGYRINQEVQYLAQAGVVNTRHLLQILQNNIDLWDASIERLDYCDHVWQLVDAKEVRQFDTVIVAAGALSQRLLPELQQISRVKPGEIAYFPTETPMQHTLGGWGAHAIPDHGGFWYGFSREDKELPQVLRDMGYHPKPIDRTWRAEKLSVNKHIPLHGALKAGSQLFVLAGAGGHGFSLMPWLAAKLAAEIL